MKFTTFSKILIGITLGSVFAWWFCGIKLSDLFNVIILSVTAWVVGMQSFATERMAKYQTVPAIDVKMIHNPSSDPPSTYFWFSNESNLPGWVYLRYKKNNSEVMEKAHQRLRVAAKSKIKTADSFFQDVKENDEVKLYATIQPAFEEELDEKLDTKFNFEKSYKFTNGQWNETSWSYPDESFPFPARLKVKNCPECKSRIHSEAKKCRYCLSILS